MTVVESLMLRAASNMLQLMKILEPHRTPSERIEYVVLALHDFLGDHVRHQALADIVLQADSALHIVRQAPTAKHTVERCQRTSDLFQPK